MEDLAETVSGLGVRTPTASEGSGQLGEVRTAFGSPLNSSNSSGFMPRRRPCVPMGQTVSTVIRGGDSRDETRGWGTRHKEVFV
jgi:hypothetical protein